MLIVQFCFKRLIQFDAHFRSLGATPFFSRYGENLVQQIQYALTFLKDAQKMASADGKNKDRSPVLPYFAVCDSPYILGKRSASREISPTSYCS